MRHWILGVAAVGLMACGDNSSSDSNAGNPSGEDAADTSGKTEDDTTAPPVDIHEPGTPGCEVYCEAITAACTGANAQYKDKQGCLDYCGTWAKLPAGTAADKDGNTIGCRTYHAGVAAKDDTAAKTHCPHAGPTGGAVCGSWCDNYCDLALANCSGGDALYADKGECAIECNKLNDSGAIGDTSGDSLQCRIYHLGVAGSDGATSAKTHCPHGAVDGGGVCVCEAQCDGKKCGDDGCGGECGTCAEGETCTADGACEVEAAGTCGVCYAGTVCDEATNQCVGDDCGGITYEGECWGENNKRVVFCEDDQLKSIDCKESCGYKEEEQYFDCVTGPCVPECTDLVCGDDGCGGTCGDCKDGEFCDGGTACVACTCDGKTCGDDGCGNSCGDCAEGQLCSAGACITPTCAGACGGQSETGCWCDAECFNNNDCCADVCTAGVCDTDFVDQCKVCVENCKDKQCGSNGCGGSCGTCGEGTFCEGEAGTCAACTCDGKTCGDDGCGESCGECGAGQACSAGACIEASCKGKCGAEFDAELPCQCDAGSFDAGDSCDDICAECAADFVEQCKCEPVCDGKACGDNGCGGNCGECAEGTVCSDAFKCEAVVCVPASCEGKECGDDGCGTPCGTCAEGKTCGEDFKCADACVPQCEGKDCGADTCGGFCGALAGECAVGATCSEAGLCEALVPPPTCEAYCADVMANCTGDNAQYPLLLACTSFCAEIAKLEAGATGDTSGNTIGCRAYHAGAAKDNPALHCAHAGATGGDVCGTLCGNYCALASSICTGDNSQYADSAACDAACAEFPKTGALGDTDGNSYQCRFYHVSVAGTGGEANATTHCPHTGASGGGVCVDPEPVVDPTCAAYCAKVTANCTGDNSQYTSESACLDYCGTWGALPLGTAADTSGNTVGCRTYHAGAAATDGATSAALHCPHAGPSGGNVCGTWCENYCHLEQTNCNDLYADGAACTAACNGFPATGKAGDTAGDSVQCKIYHLGVAGSDGATSATIHCPHGATDGGGVCVAPVPSCANPVQVDALPFTVTINVKGTSNAYNIPASCPKAYGGGGTYADGDANTPDAPLTFTPATTGTYVISHVGYVSGSPSIVSVLDGCGGEAACIGFADWTQTTSGSFALQGGTTYFIFVSPYDLSESGAITIKIDKP